MKHHPFITYHLQTPTSVSTKKHNNHHVLCTPSIETKHILALNQTHYAPSPNLTYFSFSSNCQHSITLSSIMEDRNLTLMFGEKRFLLVTKHPETSSVLSCIQMAWSSLAVKRPTETCLPTVLYMWALRMWWPSSKAASFLRGVLDLLIQNAIDA